MAATKEAKLKLPVRKPAKTVHILPQAEHNALLSASKFADAGYLSILTPTDLLIIEGDEILRKLGRMPSSEGEETPRVACGGCLSRAPPTKMSTSCWPKR